MTRYERLLVKAEELGIKVKEVDFNTDKECGFYSNNKILINSNLSEIQKYSVLAEELGHYYTTIGDISDKNNIQNIKQERLARRYGYDLLIEPNDLVEAMRNGIKDIYDMADYLGLSYSDLIKIIQDYKTRYGMGIRVGNYYLMLEPNFGIVKDFGGLFN